MDIDGLGEETIELLYKQNLVRSFPDLYKLTLEQLIPLERLGEKSATNILNSIKKSAQTPYHRVLFALGIRHVGETVAKIIAAKFRTIDELIETSPEKLTEIHEIGPKIAASIINYFADPDNIENISKLKLAGIKFTDERDNVLTGNALHGKNIVISGTFTRHSREEYKVIIERNGGRNSSSVSSKTSVILAGENMGESKKEKAEELKVPLISEDEFLKIIGEE